jgi:hypothetical protein
MLNSEETMLLNSIKEHILKAESDFEAGLITEEKLNEIYKLVDEAADEIEAISRS